jgi:hypothetical protein
MDRPASNGEAPANTLQLYLVRAWHSHAAGFQHSSVTTCQLASVSRLCGHTGWRSPKVFQWL